MKKFYNVIDSFIKEQNLNVPQNVLANTTVPPNVGTKAAGEVLNTVKDILTGQKETPNTPEDIIKSLMAALKITKPEELDPVLKTIGYQKLNNNQENKTENPPTNQTQSNSVKAPDNSYASNAPKA
jgi:hypothetical protein